jgi:hypothetical protein
MLFKPIPYKESPWSKWHGDYLRGIAFWPGYGFACPDYVTTNGRPDLIWQYMSESDAKRFKAWVHRILDEVYKQ